MAEIKQGNTEFGDECWVLKRWIFHWLLVTRRVCRTRERKIFLSECKTQSIALATFPLHGWFARSLRVIKSNQFTYIADVSEEIYIHRWEEKNHLKRESATTTSHFTTLSQTKPHSKQAEHTKTSLYPKPTPTPSARSIRILMGSIGYIFGNFVIYRRHSLLLHLSLY